MCDTFLTFLEIGYTYDQKVTKYEFIDTSWTTQSAKVTLQISMKFPEQTGYSIVMASYFRSKNLCKKQNMFQFKDFKKWGVSNP